MIHTTRMILVFMIMFSLFPFVTHASPTVFECTENPSMEGCTDNPAGDSTESESPAGEGTTDASDSEPSIAGTIVKLILVLLLVLGMIYGLLKFFNQKNKLFSRNRTMENLGGMNLAPNKSIQAVRVGEQVFILGVGDTVQMVTEVTDEKTKTSLVNREDNQQKPSMTPDWMSKLKRTKADTSQSSTIQFQQLFENQLNDMREKSKEARKKQEDRHHE
ncbi:flagellar biosynthetic protein FliO [Halobacillus locisalis]|uniref:Flagellar biosynthetic protein FliO n=1 Tax=Halobacillus locisalis TaxID=220753 RepID=A0A838CQ34_9BACI|nr:flagellar biosynthetic protein FliO [Halobacillus locisalis]MBA2174100.1 flagellar biosynthetic protein FliO [Halobacillus locisalis]